MAGKSDKEKEEEKKRKRKRHGHNIEPAEEPVEGPTGKDIFKA